MGEDKATHIVWHDGLLKAEERRERLGGRGCTLWFTGLPASGKSTVAAALEQVLVYRGIHAYRLDGDNIRHGLNRNLGFSRVDRAENIRRIGEVARLFADSGCLALTAFISPYVIDRENIRRQHLKNDLAFFEIFVNAPLHVCERRDPKGLYQMARAGQIHGFTGIDDPYEAPPRPDLVLNTAEISVEDCVRDCLGLLTRHHIVPLLP